MNDADASLVDYYRARVHEYDGIYLKRERQPDLRVVEEWVRTEFAGRDVLEIACGTGHWTRWIAASANSVAAIDAVEEMLAVARERVTLPAVRFMQCDAYALPHNFGGFNSAFAGFFLSHVPRARLGTFVAQLNGALLPGARVLFIDNRYVDGSSSPIDERDGDGNTYQQRGLADGSMHRVLKNFLTEAELRQMLAGNARDVEFFVLEYFWALRYTTPGA